MILTILRLLKRFSPQILELILIIKKKDGSVTVIPVLDEADKKFRENIRKIREWKNETQ